MNWDEEHIRSALEMQAKLHRARADELKTRVRKHPDWERDYDEAFANHCACDTISARDLSSPAAALHSIDEAIRVNRSRFTGAIDQIRAAELHKRALENLRAKYSG